MKCKFCETENEEGSVFCKQCGKRIDGKVICPSCGKACSDDSVYCNHCGKRIDGKAVCPNCGTAFSGKYCSACGTEINAKPQKFYAEAQPAYAEAGIADADDGTGWKKWVKLAGSVAGLIALATLLIFVFLIKIEPYGMASVLGTVTGEDGYGTFSVSISWLCGDAWDLIGSKNTIFDVADRIGTDFVDGYKTAYFTEAYVPTIFSLVILAASVITVITYSVIAAIRLIKSIMGKQTKGAEMPVFIAFLAYILGACLIRSIWVMHAEGFVSGLKVDMGYNFDKATEAGIALAAVFTGVMFATRVAVMGKSLAKAKNIASLVASALIIVFVSVLWTYATGAFAGYKASISGVSATEKYGFMQMLNGLDLSDPKSFVVNSYYSGNENYTTIAMLAIFGTVSVAFVSAAALYTLAIHLSNGVSEQKRTSLPAAIALTVAAVLFLILAMLALKECFDLSYGTSGNDLSPSMYNKEPQKLFAPAVIVLVFSVLSLGVSIADTVLARKFED